MNPDISLERALAFGWETMKKNFFFYLGALVVYWVILGLLSSVQGHVHDQPAHFIISLIYFVVSTLLGIGFVRIALKFIDQQVPVFSEIFSGTNYLWSYLLATIIFSFLVGLGTILLIIPGIYLAMRLQFFGYYIVDQGMDSVEALKASWAATNGLVLRLLGYDIVLILVVIAGAIALLVGLFAAVPVVMCAHAALYRQLVSQSQDPGSTITHRPVV